MKFSTTAGQLRETISRAALITPSRPQLPAYSGVFLEGTRGRISARGTNGDTTVTTVARVSDVTDGSALIPPGPVVKYLTALPDDTTIVVSTPSKTQVEIAAADAKPYKFTAMTDAFPTTPLPRRDKVAAALDGLADAVAAVAACSDALGGKEKVVQLVSSDTGLRLHATDRFRVARASLPAASGFGEFDGLLPLNVLTLVAGIGATHVQLDPKGRTMVFHSENVVVSTRLAQEPFPVVDSVLSAEVPYTVALPRTEMLAAMRRLSAVVPPNGAVLVNLRQDQVELSVINGAAGSGEEQVHLDTPASGELETAVNFDFLRTALDTHDTDQVTLGWMHPRKPLFLSSHGTGSAVVTHAIMPVEY